MLEKSPIHEIDIVINRGQFLAGNFDFVYEEIKRMRQAAPSKIFKVILETGELKSPDQITKASELAISAGADFVKTSTGKIAVGATPEAVKAMCDVIKNHFQKTGKKIGIKPSGGIRTVDDALLYRSIVSDVLGEDWLKPELFRIGASSLYDAIVNQLSHGN